MDGDGVRSAVGGFAGVPQAISDERGECPPLAGQVTTPDRRLILLAVHFSR